MKVLGVDASSSSTGTTLTEAGRVVESDVWKPTSMKADPSERLFEYSQWIGEKLYEHRPMIVVVSITSFSRSHQTTRILARYEAVTIIKAITYSAKVVEAKDSEVRKLILSKGNLSKQEAYDEVLAMEPDYPWLPFNKGGNDQTDAYVLSKAGPLLAIN